MKSYQVRNRFNSLFSEDSTEVSAEIQTELQQFIKPSDTATSAGRILAKIKQREFDTPECEIINGRARARLSREQADAVVDLVNLGRSIAQDSDKWQQHHLDIWDQYWTGTAHSNGIEHTLTSYQNPNITLKQLLWCVNSITKTQSSKAVPKFVKQAVRELRRMERRGL